jgi:hypothetical protein
MEAIVVIECRRRRDFRGCVRYWQTITLRQDSDSRLESNVFGNLDYCQITRIHLIGSSLNLLLVWQCVQRFHTSCRNAPSRSTNRSLRGVFVCIKIEWEKFNRINLVHRHCQWHTGRGWSLRSLRLAFGTVVSRMHLYNLYFVWLNYQTCNCISFSGIEWGQYIVLTIERWFPEISLISKLPQGKLITYVLLK